MNAVDSTVRPRCKVISCAATLIAAVLLVLTSPASEAAPTLDRQYEFGDPGTGDPALGATVSEGQPIGFNFGGERRTADETGPGDTNSGDTIDDSGFRDLVIPNHPNGPVYTDTSGRPLASPGEFGVKFDGVDDVLFSDPLNRPDELFVHLPDYPFDYTGLAARGLQMWVRPDQSGLNAGARQTIVMDTTEAGGVSITADGNWDQIFDSATDDGDIAATVPVVGDTWYHVMQHIHPSDDPGAPRVVPGTATDAGFTSVVYVDGVAVSAINDLHDLEQFDSDGRVGLLTVGAAEIANADDDTETAEFGEYFAGAVDDLEVYVFGDNTAQGGQDYGSFSLFADNEWIANEIATTVPGGVLQVGDVNRDGDVTIAGDVSAFVAGWLSENRLEGFGGEQITVGDWNTWGDGDMNLDGVVDLLDWSLINAANPSVGAAIAARLAAVPEPASIALVVLGGLLAGATRRRRA